MSEKQATIVFVSILVFLVLAGGGAFYYMEFEIRAVDQQKITTLNAEIETAKSQRDQIPGLEKDTERLKSENAKYEEMIPILTSEGVLSKDGKRIFQYDDLVDLIDSKRQSANVYVGSVRYTAMNPAEAPPPGQSALPPNVHRVRFDYTVKGGWFNLLRFLNLLESENRVILVESVTVQPGDESTEGRTAKRDLQVKLASYTYREQPGLPAAGVPTTGPTPTQPDTTPKPDEIKKSTLPPE